MGQLHRWHRTQAHPRVPTIPVSRHSWPFVGRLSGVPTQELPEGTCNLLAGSLFHTEKM